MSFIKFDRLVHNTSNAIGSRSNRYSKEGVVYINPNCVATVRVVSPAQDGGVILCVEVGRGDEYVLANDFQMEQLLGKDYANSTTH